MAMDVKAIVDQIVDKAKKDPDLLNKLKKDPEKTIEELSGIDIPDGSLDKVVTAVKGQITKDAAMNILGKLTK